MERFTANYSYTNDNFVIQNLPLSRREDKELPAICVALNIIQRGLPSKPSVFLLEHTLISPNTEDPVPLVSREVPHWHHTIKGNSYEGDYPAKVFLEGIIPQYLPDYAFIASLILPEASFSEIIVNVEKSYEFQAVDFYLPQASLVIEIDGQQHVEDESQSFKDKQRDEYLSKHQITTIRLSTHAIRNRNRALVENIELLRSHLDKSTVLQKYKTALVDNKLYEECLYTHLLPTAIIRLQILVLKLLEYEYISIKDECWEFQIRLHEDSLRQAFNWALEDLRLWLRSICNLQKIPYGNSKYSVKYIDLKEAFPPASKAINIDFSLLKRWTDEANFNCDAIYVRTDYVNWRRKSIQGNIQKEKYNHFKVATTHPVKYNFFMDGTESDVPHFEFLLKNIFGYDHFNSGQLPIIKNTLELRSTIGLLPTGGGKSLCYQLSILLQPCISLVISPIKALMFDQEKELHNLKIHHIKIINSDLTGETKDEIQNNFSQGRYFFIIISPERFQGPSFRNTLNKLDQHFHVGCAVIDEVHCLSEWGHDFRLSYLQLAHTIRKYCNRSNPKFLGLTATASLNVLRDIQAELKVEDRDVKTLVKYRREELTFRVINDKTKKLQALYDLIEDQDRKEGIFTLRAENSKSGIIFTPYVNGEFGCYHLAKKLQHKFKNEDIRWYAGSSPKEKINNKKTEIYDSDTLAEYKYNVQNDFKENNFSLLTATKAFGMGINKKNIFYTIHYGIPSSLEAFYQEAGRAGRDKKLLNGKKAECFILFSKETEGGTIEKILNDPDATKAELLHASEEMRFEGNDAKRQIFLMTKGLESVDRELESLDKFYVTYCIPNKGRKEVILKYNYRDKLGKNDIQYYIYRMFIFGIVEDWTVEDFYKKVYKVDFRNFRESEMIQRTKSYIQKYEKKFSLDREKLKVSDEKRAEEYYRIIVDDKIPDRRKAFRILLIWMQNNIFYSRKQSLKNLYDYCKEFEDIGPEVFKQKIEAFFTFSEATYVLQAIAENISDDFQTWFSLFWEKDGSLIKVEKFLELEGSILRYLESYRNHTGLNIIYGFVQLLSKGEVRDLRFEKEFPGLRKRLPFDEKKQFLRGSLKIGKHMNMNAKNYLANILYSFDPSLDTLHVIHKELKDYFSLHISLQKAQLKITSFNQRKNYG